MAFVQRLITVKITAKGQNINLSNLRMSAKIVKAGTQGGSADVSIWGMKQSQMNQASLLQLPGEAVGQNTITIAAGDKQRGMFTVYQGVVLFAFADMASQPEVAFRLQALTTGDTAVQSIPATSYKGGTDINTIVKQLAKQGGYTFESNVPPVLLSYPYFSGSTMTQFKKACEAANVIGNVDDGVMFIRPKNGSRKTSDPPLVSPKTGMVGYPAFSRGAVHIQTIFNPAIKFMQTIKVESSLQPANGLWVTNTLEHSLDTLLPDGQWFSVMQCTPATVASSTAAPNQAAADAPV